MVYVIIRDFFKAVFGDRKKSMVVNTNLRTVGVAHREAFIITVARINVA